MILTDYNNAFMGSFIMGVLWGIFITLVVMSWRNPSK